MRPVVGVWDCIYLNPRIFAEANLRKSVGWITPIH